MTHLDLDDPISVVLAATAAFDRARIPALVYGGVALAIFGEPRETRDADLAVVGTSAAAGKAALELIGVTVATAFEDVKFGGVSVSRLSLIGGGQLNTVDLVTPRSPRYGAALMLRPLTGELAGQQVRVVTPEDFVLLKVLSTRDRDVEDARTVLAALHGRLDLALLDREASMLAVEVPDHDVAGRYRTVMA
jgi:hypothetical protein